MLAQGIQNRLRFVGRNGKADAHAAAVRRIDRRIDADDLAGKIEGRAARVALVDRGIYLQEIIERAGVDIAAARRDDARSHGSA